jgi:hypothetical protein
MFSFAFCFTHPQPTLFPQKKINLCHQVANDGMQKAQEGGGKRYEMSIQMNLKPKTL